MAVVNRLSFFHVGPSSSTSLVEMAKKIATSLGERSGLAFDEMKKISDALEQFFHNSDLLNSLKPHDPALRDTVCKFTNRLADEFSSAAELITEIKDNPEKYEGLFEELYEIEWYSTTSFHNPPPTIN